MYVANTKGLISCMVTAQLICTFAFAYAKSRFSHDATQLCNQHFTLAENYINSNIYKEIYL